MKTQSPYLQDIEPDAEEEEAGLYDAVTAEQDLWFLPGPDPDTEEDPFAPPLPRAPRRTLIDLAEWRAAEAAQGLALNDLALDLGRLLERVETMGPGAAERLAHAEAASMSWWTGDRIGAERIALRLAWRIGATGEDAEALIRTAWAARRLAAAGPVTRDGLSRLAAHLGLDPGTGHGLLGDVAALLPGPGDLGAVATGCAAFHLWRGLEERPAHLRDIEAAVLGARLGLGGENRALGFLPLTLAGIGALTAGGPAERKLAAWIAGAHHAVLSALMTLDRLRRWRVQACAATVDLTGRTPDLLIDALARQPMVTVPQIVSETGASRPAVRRNLALMEKRGLVREVTGQGRFTVWAARL